MTALSSFPDPDIMEIPAPSVASSSSRKRRRNGPVVAHDVIELDEDDDSDAVAIVLGRQGKKKHIVKMSEKEQKKKEIENKIDEKFKSIKQFDVVNGCSDHHFFCKKTSNALSWSKSVQKDWMILQKDLPETIFVRAYEDRMDLLRAAIIGPPGTPYHDGIFFFDIYSPPDYPKAPPMVHYHSGGLRINPNLYNCGKVCLSLLNTWNGTGCEKWSSSKSTMLQVLVSIQALVLNSKPYFNEPAFGPTANTPAGEKQSLDYNDNTFLLSCRTMLYSLRRPPKHFEEFTALHFRLRGYAILVACRSYMSGARVGCLVGEDGIQDVEEVGRVCNPVFKAPLQTLFTELLCEFITKGVDCKDFGSQIVADTSLTLGPSFKV